MLRLLGTVKVAFFDPDTLQMIRVNASAPAAINLFASNYSNVTTKGPPAGGTRRYKVQIKGNLAALPATLNAGTPVVSAAGATLSTRHRCNRLPSQTGHQVYIAATACRRVKKKHGSSNGAMFASALMSNIAHYYLDVFLLLFLLLLLLFFAFQAVFPRGGSHSVR